MLAGLPWAAQFAERFHRYVDEFAAFPGHPAFPEPLRLLRLAEYLGAPAAGSHLEFPLTREDERELRESGLNANLESGAYISRTVHVERIAP